jgi:dephospho-CoA kinase
VEAPEALAIERLIARNALTREEAQARLAAQMNNAERARRARHVIRNDGSLDALAEQVQRLWEQTVRAR